MKKYTYVKIRLDLEKPMSDEAIEDLVEDIDYQVKDYKGRISDTELVEICDY